LQLLHLFAVQKCVKKLIVVISADRNSSELVFNILMKDKKHYTDDNGIEFLLPRITLK
jgi:hypothetical protein